MNVKIILGDYRYVIRSCIGLDLNFKAELAHRGQQGGGGWRVQQLLLRSSRQTAAASLSLSLLGSLARSHSLSLLFSFTYAHTHMLQRQWTGRTPRKQIRSLSFKFASAAAEERNFVFFFFDKRT